MRGGMLAAWLAWLFAKLVVPLLRAHFYVTDGEGSRQLVLYYRRGPWPLSCGECTLVTCWARTFRLRKSLRTWPDKGCCGCDPRHQSAILSHRLHQAAGVRPVLPALAGPI